MSHSDWRDAGWVNTGSVHMWSSVCAGSVPDTRSHDVAWQHGDQTRTLDPDICPFVLKQGKHNKASQWGAREKDLKGTREGREKEQREGPERNQGGNRDGKEPERAVVRVICRFWSPTVTMGACAEQSEKQVSSGQSGCLRCVLNVSLHRSSQLMWELYALNMSSNSKEESVLPSHSAKSTLLSLCQGERVNKFTFMHH